MHELMHERTHTSQGTIERRAPRVVGLTRALRAATATAALVAPLAAPAQFVTELRGASGSAVGAGQALYVTEGPVGRLSRVDPATRAVTTVAKGWPGPVIGVGGAVDVVCIDGTAYVLLGMVGFPFGGGVDGHRHRGFHLTLDGAIREFKAFDHIVPTGLDVAGRTVFLAQAGTVPLAPGDAKVVSFGLGPAPAVEVCAGAPLPVDVPFGRGRTLFARAQGPWDAAFPGSPAPPDTGSLVRFDDDGNFTVVASGLDRPTSMQLIGTTA